MTTSGLISDDQIISDELTILQANVAQLKAIVEADRGTLQMVTNVEPLLDILPADDGKRLVLFSSERTGLVVDHEWVGRS